MDGFIDDKEKMIDFVHLTKEEFLKLYSYLTVEEYDVTLQELCINYYKRLGYELDNSWDKENPTLERFNALLDSVEEKSITLAQLVEGGTNKTTEWCSHCNSENEISIVGEYCKCGKWLKPCSMCDMYKVTCKQCLYEK